MSRFPEGQLIRRAVTSLYESLEHESLEQPIRAAVADLHDDKWRGMTIEMLPEDILLEIFDFYRQGAIKRSRGRPWKWHILAHVCRQWRHVISMAPRRLDLRILCEYGAHFIDILQSWPTLPLVVRYNDPKSRSLFENIIVSLRRPDQVWEIDLVLSSSLIGSIVPVLQEPFPGLECIRITIKDTTGLPLLVRGSFLGGSAPHVKEIKLDGIAFPFPAIRQVLSSTNNLVELQLSIIPNDVYFSPVDLVNTLSTLIHLKVLTIRFRSPASRPQLQPPPMTKTRLLSLTLLDFHGASEYLENFVSRIDLPSLCNINIKLFNQIIFEIPHFCSFIHNLQVLRSPTLVSITHSAESVNVIFIQDGKPLSGYCSLGTSCQRLDWQLSFVTQLTTQLSPFILSNVQSLVIDDASGSDMPTGVEDVVPGIVQALVMGEEEAHGNGVAAGVLPELNSLHLLGYRRSRSVVKDAEQFVSARRLAGRTVRLDG